MPGERTGRKGNRQSTISWDKSIFGKEGALAHQEGREKRASHEADSEGSSGENRGDGGRRRDVRTDRSGGARARGGEGSDLCGGGKIPRAGRGVGSHVGGGEEGAHASREGDSAQRAAKCGVCESGDALARARADRQWRASNG